MSTRKQDYRAPNEPMNISERCAHYLAWCEKARHGEYIPYQDVAQIVHNTKSKPSRKSILAMNISRAGGHVRKVLREKYHLAWDTSEIGVRALNDVHAIAQHTVRKHVEKINNVKRGLDADLVLVEERKDKFENNKEGRELKGFISRVKSNIGQLSLPSREEIRALLPPKEE